MKLNAGDRIFHKLTGQKFLVIDNALDTETGGIVTVYKSVDDGSLRVRRSDDFENFRKLPKIN